MEEQPNQSIDKWSFRCDQMHKGHIRKTWKERHVSHPHISYAMGNDQLLFNPLIGTTKQYFTYAIKILLYWYIQIHLYGQKIQEKREDNWWFRENKWEVTWNYVRWESLLIPIWLNQDMFHGLENDVDNWSQFVEGFIQDTTHNAYSDNKLIIVILWWW